MNSLSFSQGYPPASRSRRIFIKTQNRANIYNIPESRLYYEWRSLQDWKTSYSSMIYPLPSTCSWPTWPFCDLKETSSRPHPTLLQYPSTPEKTSILPGTWADREPLWCYQSVIHTLILIILKYRLYNFETRRVREGMKKIDQSHSMLKAKTRS